MAIQRQPLHIQIARVLRRELATRYKPGDRFPSQNELARRFEVSPPTAREAVGLLVQEGLLERRFGSGTYVTQKQNERWIGILIELDISDRHTSYFYLRAVQVLRQFMADRNYLTRLYAGRSRSNESRPPLMPTCEEFYKDLEAGKLHGLITLSYGWTKPFTDLMTQHDLVAIGRNNQDGSPYTDYSALVRDAVDYVADAGRKRIAFIQRGHNDRTNNPLFGEFIDHLRRRNLPVDPALMVGVWPDTDIADGIAAFRQIWQEAGERPDALIVTDDKLYEQMAPILLYNRIELPGDLMVVAHGNVGDIDGVHPEPIRFLFDADEFAEALGEQLLLRLKDPAAKPESVAITARLAEPAGLPQDLHIA